MNTAYLRLTSGYEKPGEIYPINIESTMATLNAFVGTFAGLHESGEQFRLNIGGQMTADQKMHLWTKLLSAFTMGGEVNILHSQSDILNDGPIDGYLVLQCI